ncbi:MAG: hypothetical protein AB1805_15570 [Nitrospirota bacterium]
MVKKELARRRMVNRAAGIYEVLLGKGDDCEIVRYGDIAFLLYTRRGGACSPGENARAAL